MTMTRKWQFFIATVGILIASLASLVLPLYYTQIIDIVQMNTGSRAELVPVLIGILVSMAIIELFSIG